MTLDTDIILSILFAGIPFLLGWTVILNWVLKSYWNWLWKGIKHKCALCQNVKEVKIND
jgi:hypothetical protein